jgi:hypothetical protein
MKAPTISLSALPEAERSSARSIAHTLRQLNSFTETFEQCVALFEFCFANRHSQPPSRWHTIAAEHGAITLFNFSEALISIRADYFHSCPSLRAVVDFRRLRTAYRLFGSNFSDFVNLRHAIAHAGLRGHQKHHVFGTIVFGGVRASSSPTEGMIIGTILHGDKFHTAWEGKMVSYEVNRASAQKLYRVLTLCYESFTAKNVAG